MKEVLGLLFAVSFAFGCSPTGDGSSGGDSENEHENPGEGDSDADGDTERGGAGDGEADTDTDTDADADGDDRPRGPVAEIPDGGEECGGWDLDIELKPARLMLLQDLSSSMSEGSPSKWEQARNALVSLINTYGFSELLEIGFDIFPDRRDCHADEPLVLDTTPESGQKIFDVLRRLELSQSTPLYMAMRNFLDPGYAPVFSQQDIEHYLVVISDGKDTCGSEPGGSPMESQGATAVELGDLAARLNAELGIVTMAIGFGSGADPEQLNAVARNGGSTYDEYFVAGDRAELEAVFNEIAAFAISCTFDVAPEQPAEDIDMDQVNFYFDGNPVYYDENCAQSTGWTYTDGDRDTVRFCEQACEMIKSGDVQEISAKFGCERFDIIVV